MGLFDAAASTTNTLVNNATNLYIAHKNREAQKEQQNYERALQREMMAREDNSVQRRAQDLEKSGLSKTLATGASASAGPVIKTSPPQLDYKADISNVARDTLALIQAKEQIASTEAQRNLTNSQKLLTDVQSGIKLHDLKIYKDSGMASNASGLAKAIRDIYGLGDSTPVQQQKGNLKRTLDKAGEASEWLRKKITPDHILRAEEQERINKQYDDLEADRIK